MTDGKEKGPKKTKQRSNNGFPREMSTSGRRRKERGPRKYPTPDAAKQHAMRGGGLPSRIRVEAWGVTATNEQVEWPVAKRSSPDVEIGGRPVKLPLRNTP